MIMQVDLVACPAQPGQSADAHRHQRIGRWFRHGIAFETQIVKGEEAVIVDLRSNFDTVESGKILGTKKGSYAAGLRAQQGTCLDVIEKERYSERIGRVPRMVEANALRWRRGCHH